MLNYLPFSSLSSLSSISTSLPLSHSDMSPIYPLSLFIQFFYCSAQYSSYQNEVDSLRFFVIGDIGGIPVWEVTSVQKQVAKAMINRSKGVKSIINLGDNFYFTGVMSDTDPRFNTTFEDVYRDTAIPWLTIAGNHDHFGNVQAQISYTSKSKLWYFPSLYYNKVYQEGNISVEFIMLDTIELCGNSVDVQSGKIWDVIKDTIKKKWNGEKMKPKDPQKAEEQWIWLEKTLNNSKADYVFVGGHYPVYSISSHGPTQCLVDRLIPLLKKYKVTAYFSGHDHSLQHLESDGITYIVSGAGSRSDQSTAYKDRLKGRGITTHWHYPPFSLLHILSQLGVNDGGFVELNIIKNRTTVVYLNKEGAQKYASYLYPRWMAIPNSDLGKSIDEEL
ncbi:hypothetical protein PRIPAC_85956 [Pristionchus pacificus]|uniref:Tartrate-resistant acid phosphatase type 5 n=1 Tax=Pristionchus pacificus TaxID=54126 RepID=A0A2A6CCE2_PRIPA|nr:hypothetical protein PRIPAC_85956 [Pristionchus pacificus]|eukprot:PDM75681.1 Calcineurin-like phosphoesterase [Pristionchus pacificus]